MIAFSKKQKNAKHRSFLNTTSITRAMTLAGDSKYKDRAVIGFIENVTCHSKDNGSLHVRARIDSGATKSSIDIALAEKLGLGPVIGEKTIRNAHGRAVRQIIEVEIEFAGKTITETFTLADRSTMRFPVLIGRNILKKGFLIDPEKKAPKKIEVEE